MPPPPEPPEWRPSRGRSPPRRGPTFAPPRELRCRPLPGGREGARPAGPTPPARAAPAEPTCHGLAAGLDAPRICRRPRLASGGADRRRPGPPDRPAAQRFLGGHEFDLFVGSKEGGGGSSGNGAAAPASAAMDDETIVKGIDEAIADAARAKRRHHRPRHKRRREAAEGGTDYVALVDAMYRAEIAKAAGEEPGMVLDLRAVIDDARAADEDGNPAEAVRIYRELCEGISHSIDLVDDDDSYHSTCFADAVDGMAESTKKLDPASQKRQITHMLERYISNEPEYLADEYISALWEVCGADPEYLGHWMRKLTPLVRGAAEASRRGGSAGSHAAQLLRMKAGILKEIGDEPGLERFLRKHCHDDSYLCTLHVRRLHKSGSRGALAAAEAGAAVFPGDGEVAEVLRVLRRAAGKAGGR